MAGLIPAVRAAGGVVGRDGRIAVIYRARYDDWTLPKGKAEADETDEDCAVREVEEETGLLCKLGSELPRVRYRDRKQRLKEVRYWAMEPLSGELHRGTEEIDEVRWASVDDAMELLTHVHDREVVAAWAALP